MRMLVRTLALSVGMRVLLHHTHLIYLLWLLFGVPAAWARRLDRLGPDGSQRSSMEEADSLSYATKSSCCSVFGFTSPLLLSCSFVQCVR